MEGRADWLAWQAGCGEPENGRRLISPFIPLPLSTQDVPRSHPRASAHVGAAAAAFACAVRSLPAKPVLNVTKGLARVHA